MKKNWTLRLGALGLAGLATLIACEASQVTGLGSDGNPPFVEFVRPDSALGGVSASRPVSLTVHAGDDMSLKSLADTIYLDQIVSGTLVRTTAYSAKHVFTSATPTFDDPITVTLSSAREGDTVRLVGVAEDGNGNVMPRRISLPVLPRMPHITIDSVNGSPTVVGGVQQPTTIRVGDPINAVATILSDSVPLASFDAQVVSIRGNPRYGADTVILYTLAKNYTPQQTMYFRLNPTADSVTAQDSVIKLVVRSADILGNDNFAEQPIRIVSGPKIVLTSDSIAWINKDLRIRIRAMDYTGGVASLSYTITLVRGTTTSVLLNKPLNPGGADSVDFVEQYTVPSNLQVNDVLLVTATARDGGGNDGSGNALRIPVVTEPPDGTAPLVYQTLPARLEQGMSLAVRGTDPSRIRRVGFILRAGDDTTKVIASGSTPLLTAAQRVSDTTVRFTINFADAWRGHPAFLYSWAEDSLGNKGWSLPSGVAVPETDSTRAQRDNTLLVYGVTHAFPTTGSKGMDIAPWPAGNKVFISDISKSVVQIWDAATGTFSATPVKAGSNPWGLAIDPVDNYLLVANSGGRNISVVDLGSLTELDAMRITTPASRVSWFNWSYDPTKDIIKYTGVTNLEYSSRPTFLSISANNDIFYSTLPTMTAPDGTIRRIETPFTPATRRERQIWNYARATTTVKNYVIFNADSVFTYATGPNTNDLVRICDSPRAGGASVCSPLYVDPQQAADTLVNAIQSDVEVVANIIDPTQLALTDTTFVTAGGDRRRIAFGEGHTSSAGRVLLALDSAGMSKDSIKYSAPVQVRDLTNNAAMHVYGIALDSVSSTLAVHGDNPFFADTALTLMGQTPGFGAGAGVVFHPQNVGSTTAVGQRVAFIAGNDTTVAVIDSWHFDVRGSMPIKANLYGPMRAVKTATGVRLYGLTSEGLVTIDVAQCDIDNVDAAACPTP